jgi:soluble lytic murein transglycosylase-like protein
VSVSAPAKLVAIAVETAHAHDLDPSLVCAVIEQESGWNPWAMRYEPAFFAKYVASLYTNNKVSASEAYARGFSWGLMQVMGQVARENGFSDRFLSGLCDPNFGIEYGCRVLRKKLDLAKGDTLQGLLAWNGGGNPNYAVEVLDRRGAYASIEKTELRNG